MRLIYVDEAGTSANEPVSVVVGIIVNADTRWLLVENELNKILSRVPEPYNDGFIFHAKDIWGSKKYRDVWSLDSRLETLHSVMNLPRNLGLAISFGICRRHTFDDIANEQDQITACQMEHAIAFNYCVERADRYIREYAKSQEIGILMVEDVPEMRRFLRNTVKIMKSGPIFPLPQKPTLREQETGTIVQNPADKISRIKDGAHFVGKADAPLLQIADACAFGLRRFFAEQKFGDEFVQSILGTPLIREDWSGNFSGGLFFPEPKNIIKASFQL